jgi:myo-inositol-1(or 4)-monophosphatase
MDRKQKISNWSSVLRRAGASGRKAILRNYTYSSRHQIIGKGMGGDMTLRIDKVSEKAIYNSLKRDLGRSFVFLSEEMGEVSPPSSENLPVVVCDPLDGSHNAEVGIPLFSLALSVIEPELGGRTFGNVTNALITSVKTDDEFYATKGKGSFYNGKRIRADKSETGRHINTLLIESSDLEYLGSKITSKLSKNEVNKTRLLGSAAISYCMLASGGGDGYVFAQPGGARTIDSPAGYLIAKEAGCVFSNLTEGLQDIPINQVPVAFSSRVNLVGARDSEILSLLVDKLVGLP